MVHSENIHEIRLTYPLTMNYEPLTMIQ